MFHIIRTSLLQNFRRHMVVPGPSDPRGKLKHFGDPRECESDVTAEAAGAARGFGTGICEGGGSAWNPGFPPISANGKLPSWCPVPGRPQHQRPEGRDRRDPEPRHLPAPLEPTVGSCWLWRPPASPHTGACPSPAPGLAVPPRPFSPPNTRGPRRLWAPRKPASRRP